MYVPQAFSEDRPEVLREAIRRIVFATLVTARGDRPQATLLPLLFEEGQGPHGRLLGHVARANDHWEAIAPGQPALVLFQGEQAYVSPAWYPSKSRHGRVVPTWNYIAVEARGTATTFQEPARLQEVVAALTAHQEAGRAAPWAVSDAPPDFVAAQLKGIVGIEITVSEIVGKWKLSQNRSREDRLGVAAGLAGEPASTAKEAAAAVARALEEKA